MVIRKDNILIRDAKIEDARVLCDWWNDGAVMAHAGFPNGLGTDIERVAGQIGSATGNNHLLIIEIDQVPCGEIKCATPAPGVAEIGIKICDASLQNRGFGTSILRLLIDHLFNTLDYQKVALDTNLENTRARHVYEKIGFKETAIHRDSWRDQTGTLRSAVYYELCRDDFHLPESAGD